MAEMLKLSSIVLKFGDDICGDGFMDLATQIGGELPLTNAGMAKLLNIFDNEDVANVLLAKLRQHNEDVFKELAERLGVPFCENCYDDYVYDILNDTTKALTCLSPEKKRNKAYLETLKATLKAMED